MKINFGELKRKNLVIGDNKKMRPTQSMAKSIIFNLLEIDNNTKVLDLFAGTGSLGFESTSLGAGTVYWSDNNIESVKAIEKNIEQFKLDKKNFKVFKSDFRMVLKKVPFKIDILFLDPPFIATKYYDEALEIIKKNNVLSDYGVIVIERPYKVEISRLNDFTIKENRRMGEKDIIILSK